MQLDIALDGAVGAVRVRRVHRPTHERFANNGVAVVGVHDVGTGRQRGLVGNLNIANQIAGIIGVRNILLKRQSVVLRCRTVVDDHCDDTTSLLVLTSNRNIVVAVQAVEPNRTLNCRIGQSGSAVREGNGLGEPSVIILVREVRVGSQSKQLGVELTGGQRNLEGLLTRQHGNWEHLPAGINLSRLSVRGRGRLGDLVEVEHMAIATLEPNTRDVSDIALISCNVLRHNATHSL